MTSLGTSARRLTCGQFEQHRQVVLFVLDQSAAADPPEGALCQHLLHLQSVHVQRLQRRRRGGGGRRRYTGRRRGRRHAGRLAGRSADAVGGPPGAQGAGWTARRRRRQRRRRRHGVHGRVLTGRGAGNGSRGRVSTAAAAGRRCTEHTDHDTAGIVTV